ncbi:MAG: ABC transporter ATP-binding protein [Verrucomicrobiota bacterium]
MKLYFRILGVFKPFAWRISVGLIFLLLTIGVHLLKPWPLKYLIDDVFNQEGPNYYLPFLDQSFTGHMALFVLALVLVLIYLVWGVANMVKDYWQIDIGLKAVLHMRKRLYEKLHELPMSYHDQRSGSDSTFRVVYDAQSFQTFFNAGFDRVLSSLLTLVAMLTVMWTMNATLTLIALAVVPGFILVIGFFGVHIRRRTTVMHEKESKVLARATEGFASLRIVKAFVQELRESKRFTQSCAESHESNQKLQFINVASILCVSVVTALGTSMLFYYGGKAVLDGDMKIGDLTVFLTYLTMLYQPLEQLSYTAWAMEGAAAGTDRVFQVLDQTDHVPDVPQAKPLVLQQGCIHFDNVSFAYEPGKMILKNISLNIEPGQTVAFVGGTGAGKTTLLSLLPRFYDTSEGEVSIDGQAISQVKKSSLRHQIAMVMQETVLLAGTIRENIAYAEPDAPEYQIKAAAREAQIHEFIQGLPDGYESQVGERGVRLSGGQRQRLGIARAILKRSSILLLDEPTSSLDLATEAEVMKALTPIMNHTTTVIVTHRLSTIHHVDRIFVLDKGCLVESGTGSELLKKKGVYWKLYNARRTPR